MYKILLFFALAFFLTLTVSLPIQFFPLPLAMCLYRFSKNSCSFIALAVGCLLDGIYHMPRFGILGSSYLLSAFFLYPMHRVFFIDAFTTLPLMTYLFSAFAALFQWQIALLLDLPTFGWLWVCSEAFVMPLLDGIAALCLFSLPQSILTRYYSMKRRKRHAT